MTNPEKPGPFSAREALATQAAVAAEPAPFPQKTATEPFETCYDDWRERLRRNLSRRSDGRWEPLTRVHGAE
jgi:hypothetical protein